MGEYSPQTGTVRITVRGLPGDTRAVSDILMVVVADAVAKHMGDAVTGREVVFHAPGSTRKQ